MCGERKDAGALVYDAAGVAVAGAADGAVRLVQIPCQIVTPSRGGGNENTSAHATPRTRRIGGKRTCKYTVWYGRRDKRTAWFAVVNVVRAKRSSDDGAKIVGTSQRKRGCRPCLGFKQHQNKRHRRLRFSKLVCTIVVYGVGVENATTTVVVGCERVRFANDWAAARDDRRASTKVGCAARLEGRRAL